MSRAQFIGLATIMVISSFAGGATMAWLMKPIDKPVLHAKGIYAERIVLETKNPNGSFRNTIINPGEITLSSKNSEQQNSFSALLSPDIMWLKYESKKHSEQYSTIAQAGHVRVEDHKTATVIGGHDIDVIIDKNIGSETCANIAMYENNDGLNTRAFEQKGIIWKAP